LHFILWEEGLLAIHHLDGWHLGQQASALRLSESRGLDDDNDYPFISLILGSYGMAF